MTVAELIEELKEYPPELGVCFGVQIECGDPVFEVFADVRGGKTVGVTLQ